MFESRLYLAASLARCLIPRIAGKPGENQPVAVLPLLKLAKHAA